MNDDSPSARVLRFAVTGALLAGSVGCTDDPPISVNPGPAPTPSPVSSPTPGSERAATPPPAAEPAESPAATPVAPTAPSPPLETDVMTNPGPDRDPRKD